MKPIGHLSGMVEARYRMRYFKGNIGFPTLWPLGGVSLIHDAVKKASRDLPIFEDLPAEKIKNLAIARRNLRVFGQELKLVAQGSGGWWVVLRAIYTTLKGALR